MEYGRAGDCYSNSQQDCRKGKFKINIAETGLKLDNSLKWMATGTPQDDYRITQFKVSPSNTAATEVSAHCGGSCSECMPAEHLQLTPKICVNSAAEQTTNQQEASLPSSAAKTKQKRSLRQKRAKLDKKGRKNKWFRFWPFW